MIIRYEGNEYIVVDVFFRQDQNNICGRNMLCWNIKESCFRYIDFFAVEVVDGRFPANMCMHMTQAAGSPNNIALLEHDMICRELSWFWEALDDDVPKARLLFHKVINEMKEFHGLPIDDLSELEEEVRREEMVQKPLTEEERRAKELSDELDEYLRIGEEIEREKDMQS